MRRICVIGAGYVGLTTGICLADLGNNVTLLDTDTKRIAAVKQGELPIFEPGLGELLQQNLRAGRVYATTSYAAAVPDAEFVFIAVATPTAEEHDGADLRYVEAAATELARNLSAGRRTIVINKSTVPIGTGDWVANILAQHAPVGAQYAVVSNPEFLREGQAVLDFQQPDRVVLGSTATAAAQEVATLYLSSRAPIIITDLRTAEMIKYASNAFLATRISFINEIARICEQLGANVREVALGMGYDRRIGRAFLDAGVGFGGSCFPKDLRALAHMADEAGLHPQLLRAVLDINRDQRLLIVEKLRRLLGSLEGKRVGLLGLTFKPNTDDLRDAPALDIARALLEEGVHVAGYDPAGMERAQQLVPGLETVRTPYDVAKGADALVLVTEWNEFKQLDWNQIRKHLRRPLLIDGRNMYDAERIRSAGLVYEGIGVGCPTPPVALQSHAHVNI
ncbi:MAG: UDP-glucose/GDP-mannose dehydrogenase family protein [Chloroflexi bacterium]|nr:UDP-glucose/GDP-mannose dehydrogenase family protein [Chloroflexota bacterium]